MPPVGYDFPPLSGRVVDRADVIPPQVEAQLAAGSELLEQATGHQFVIVTVSGLGGHTIEDYGRKLGNFWGVGRECCDDGVVLLVAPREHRVRIETGKSLTETLTDAEAKRIIEKDILPFFRRGAMSMGVAAGAAAISAELMPEQNR